MSASTSTRYDFGRCTVEHVDAQVKQTRGAFSGTYIGPPSKAIVVRMKQAHGGDDALVTLLDFDARGLASKILDLLGAE